MVIECPHKDSKTNVCVCVCKEEGKQLQSIGAGELSVLGAAWAGSYSTLLTRSLFHTHSNTLTLTHTQTRTLQAWTGGLSQRSSVTYGRVMRISARWTTLCGYVFPPAEALWAPGAGFTLNSARFLPLLLLLLCAWIWKWRCVSVGPGWSCRAETATLKSGALSSRPSWDTGKP